MRRHEVSQRWRHRARESALQVLYQWEIGKVDIEKAAETFFTQQWADAEPPTPDVRAFAEMLARETVTRLEVVDALIATTAEHWRPERLAVIDRLVLRLATTELLLNAPDAPAPVVIDEALELARTFSTEDAVKFVNGMLDAVRRKIDAQR